MKKTSMMKLCILLLTVFALIFSGCTNPMGPEAQEEPGQITGKAYYQNSDNNQGITISIEAADGLKTAAVDKTGKSGKISRSVFGNTTTAADGSYSFEDVAPGNYTVYASSQSSSEKAVMTNVVVESAKDVTVADLNLTAVSSINGKVVMDGTADGNLGFLVFVAGTSWMAITDSTGSFVISDIPAGQTYEIIIMKNDKFIIWDSVALIAGSAGDMGTRDVTSDTFTDPAIALIWKGTLTGHPADPGVNWAYYNSADGCSYIYDGTAWQIFSRDGEDGEDGDNGLPIVWQGELAAAPSDPQLNWAYYNTTDRNSYIYDGTEWDILALAGAGGLDGEDGQDGDDGATGAAGADGISIIWRGEYAAAPASPQLNWAYYNSTDGNSYIWDGSSWDILAHSGEDGDDGDDGATGNTGEQGPAGADGVSIVWQGELASAPANPQLNWAYYNTTDFTSYIYNGSSWEQMTQSALPNYAVVFETNGGSAVAPMVVRETETIGSVSAPVRSGYIFKAWFLDSGLTNEWDLASEPVVGNITLYADWWEIFTFTFVTNGGDAVTPRNVQEGGSFSNPPECTRSGFVFGGWYEDAALTTPWNTSTVISSDVILYAKWNVTVSFDTNGSATVIADIEVAENGLISEPSVTPEEPYGFSFDQWYADSACTIVWDFAADTVSVNTCLYAGWSWSFSPAISNLTVDTYTIGMSQVPGGLTTPSSNVGSGYIVPSDLDSGSATVDDSYFIAETEVPYDLWYAVRVWGEANGYSFDNTGQPGSAGNAGDAVTAGNSSQPVTGISWCEAIKWCNALTDYYNANNGAADDLSKVYYYDSSLTIPVTTSATSGSQPRAYIKEDTDGFRLPNRAEWELAARIRGDAVNSVSGYSSPWFTTGASVSGADETAGDNDETKDHCWYARNADPSSTKEIGTKDANYLLLHDMCGNASEIVYDTFYYSSSYSYNGFYYGGYYRRYDAEVSIGEYSWNGLSGPHSYTGFRLARNAE